MSPPCIVWFRRDLRLDDNPALHRALQSGAPVLPLYIWCPEEEGDWATGAASRVWLHESLGKLDQDLASLGSRLIIRTGRPLDVFAKMLGSTGLQGVFWNRLYEPALVKRDRQLKTHLKKQGVKVQSFKAALLNEPMDILNKQGRPYKVFTAYWKFCKTLEPPLPMARPQAITPLALWPSTETLEALQLKPSLNWYAGIQQSWQMGSAVAQQKLARFLRKGLEEYSTARDYPGLSVVSSLSPHLHFGEISPRQIWHRLVADASPGSPAPGEPATAYLRQLYWREFAHYLLFHFPHTTNEPLYEKYRTFPFVSDPEKLRAWQKGLTGYPIVDAGMRELWHSGSMHNRVRMIAGSFLVKDLLIRWQEGAKWFWDTLVDADLANNTLGWQWLAGCGADAAPFFRIFNPVRQGETYDAKGDYVRKWLPELSALDNKIIHSPWRATETELKNCGITLGLDYPLPIVDHAAARKRALAALSGLNEAS